MSTRATIRVEDNEGEGLWIYHHCDGYPQGVGEELKELLVKVGKYADIYDVANYLFKYGKKYGDYELTSDLHGDSEFVYNIDMGSRTLECYAYPFEEEDLEFTFDF